jgi:hypothetical protein
VAELDARFSDPDATPTPWAEAVRRFDEAELFWISTVRVDGTPHVAGGAFHGEGGEALVFEVVPSKVLAFADGHFAQTRYRF